MIVPVAAILLLHPRCFAQVFEPPAAISVPITANVPCMGRASARDSFQAAVGSAAVASSLLPSVSATSAPSLYDEGPVAYDMTCAGANKAQWSRTGPGSCGVKCIEAGGFCKSYCATKAPQLLTPVDLTVAYQHEWAWDTSCPSTVLELYGNVFATAVLLQGVLFNAVALLRRTVRCGKLLGGGRARRCCGRGGGRASSAVVTGYSRMFNIIEVVVVFGPYYPPIAWAAALALPALWVTARAMKSTAREAAAAEDGRVVAPLADARGVPGVAVVLTVVMAGAVAALVLGGGDLLASDDAAGQWDRVGAWRRGSLWAILYVVLGLGTLIVAERAALRAAQREHDDDPQSMRARRFAVQ